MRGGGEGGYQLTWTTRLVPIMMSRSQAAKSVLTLWWNLSGRFSPKKTMSGLTRARQASQRGMTSSKMAFFIHSWLYSWQKTDNTNNYPVSIKYQYFNVKSFRDIRILEEDPDLDPHLWLTTPDPDPSPDPTPFFSDFNDAKKNFLLITHPQAQYLQS